MAAGIVISLRVDPERWKQIQWLAAQAGLTTQEATRLAMLENYAERDQPQRFENFVDRIEALCRSKLAALQDD